MTGFATNYKPRKATYDEATNVHAFTDKFPSYPKKDFLKGLLAFADYPYVRQYTTPQWDKRLLNQPGAKFGTDKNLYKGDFVTATSSHGHRDHIAGTDFTLGRNVGDPDTLHIEMPNEFVNPRAEETKFYDTMNQLSESVLWNQPDSVRDSIKTNAWDMKNPLNWRYFDELSYRMMDYGNPEMEGVQAPENTFQHYPPSLQYKAHELIFPQIRDVYKNMPPNFSTIAAYNALRNKNIQTRNIYDEHNPDPNR